MGGGPSPGAPPGPGQSGRPSRRPPWVLIALLIIVLAGGVGAAAVLLSGGHGHSPSSQATPSNRPSSAAATPTHTASSPPASSTPGQGKVGVAASVTGDAQTPQVVALLDRYFNAINTHNYPGYFGLLTTQQQQQISQSQFDKGFASTKDSSETLQTLSAASGGDVTVTVTFTSHQDPADSINGHESCTNWHITMYLQRSGGSYLIGKPPSGYKASYSAC
jgi:hypothetical protein